MLRTRASGSWLWPSLAVLAGGQAWHGGVQDEGTAHAGGTCGWTDERVEGWIDVWTEGRRDGGMVRCIIGSQSTAASLPCSSCSSARCSAVCFHSSLFKPVAYAMAECACERLLVRVYACMHAPQARRQCTAAGRSQSTTIARAVRLLCFRPSRDFFSFLRRPFFLLVSALSFPFAGLGPFSFCGTI